jgi:hypothetical protein
MPPRGTKKRRVINLAKMRKIELAKLAAALFSPTDKNPYYSGCLAIANLRELHQHLELFSPDAALWLAQWLEYLGDTATASKIRTEPDRFRQIVVDRYEELKEFAPT